MGCCACLGFTRNALRAKHCISTRSGPGSRAHLFGRNKGAKSLIPGSLCDTNTHSNPSSSTRYVELNVFVAKKEAAENVDNNDSAHANVSSGHGIIDDSVEAATGADPNHTTIPHNPVAPGSSRANRGFAHFNRRAHAGAGATDEVDGGGRMTKVIGCMRAWCCEPRCCAVATAVFCVLFIALTIAFWPLLPNYNVCATEFQWSSIIEGLQMRGGLEGDEKLLISIHNLDRFGLEVTHVRAAVRHRGAKIGTFEYDGAYGLAAGSITDVMALVKFTPSVYEALMLLYDFERSSLNFSIAANITGNIMLGRIPLYRLNSTISEHTVEVFAPAANDRRLCKCQESRKLL